MASTGQQTAASISRLRKRLSRVPLEVRAAASAQALIERNNLVVALRGSSPKDDVTLRDSIRLEQGKYGDKFFVKAGGPTTTKPVHEGASATYDYVFASEYGTEHQPARAWFFQTFRVRRKAIRKRIEDAARAAAARLSD